ncbi:unnamed protein product [Calypogeia fissa]
MAVDDVQEDVVMEGESDVDNEVGEEEVKGEVEEENGGNVEEADQEESNEEVEDVEAEKEEDSESEDSDSGYDDEDDLLSDKQAEKLEASLAANPYSYDIHVQLIASLRRAGLLEKLRTAREAMNQLYPLTPDMWREWAQDEARLIAGVEDVQAVEALYERGIQDYLSVPLWLEYLKFVEEHDTTVAEGTKEGVSNMRNLYERALAAVGLHFAEGGKVWEAYREFEQAMLMIIDSSGGEGKVKQVEIVRSLFRRQLTIPLGNLADTLQEYKEWEGQQGNHIGDDLAGLPSHVGLAYKKALQLCSIRELHEGKIAKGQPGDAELLQHYLGYVSIEEATGEPARAQILYERAVAAFPVNQDVWIKYIQYLETNLKVFPVLKGVYARAVRNCPWVEPLWRSYLLALERFRAPETELSAVFEQSLHGGFQTAQEYLDLFLTRCDGLRRRIMAAVDVSDRQSDILLLHNTFDRAAQFLATYYPDHVDRTLQLHAYWADMEAHVVKDLVAARGAWEGLIKSSGWMTEVWQGYISMELALKNIKEARAIYRSCYSRRLEGSGTEVMCSAWLRFEREHGSLEDYDRAVMKVTPRLAEIQVMQLQQEVKSTQNVEPRSVQQVATVGDNKATEQPGSSGQKSTEEHSVDPAAAKRKRVLDSRGFKVPKPVLKKSKVEEIPKDAVMGNASQKTLKTPKSPRVYTDECTAFVSNIAFEVTEDQLREFFTSVAGVKEVRLLREKATGRPRGLAYVDFEDEESLAAAIKKDKQEFGGRQLTVARSAPTGGRGGGRGNFGRGRGDFGHRGGHQGRGRGEDNRGDSSSGRARGSGSVLGHRRGGKVSMTGSNTFAVPRNVVRPLGWNPGQDATGDEVMKSNDEFRKLLLSKK